jgi:hypothetical protein
MVVLIIEITLIIIPRHLEYTISFYNMKQALNIIM